MKTLRYLGLMTAIVLALCALPSYALEEGYSGPKAEFVPGEVIVKMKPQMRLMAADLSALGIQPKDRLTSGGEIIYHITPSIMGAMSAIQVLDRTMEIVEQLKKGRMWNTPSPTISSTP